MDAMEGGDASPGHENVVNQDETSQPSHNEEAKPTYHSFK